MNKFQTAALCGVAALCGAGIGMAASSYGKVMKLDLPDGSIAQIEYHGAVAPKVRIAPATPLEPLAVVAPLAASPLDGFATDLDRQVKAIIGQANMLQYAQLTSNGQPNLTTFGSLPAGTVSYQSVSTSNGKAVCTRSWQLTSQGPNQHPKVISSSSGECAGLGQQAPKTGTKQAPVASRPTPGSQTV